ncbi:hypothetical protein FOMG_15489 [Fusarium oxysporum f. sp. melonis 26406]|uniref:Uncharacterized protein n=1 Tax=Fusarium oxysporum f. sp. melonis 26406 TaxID=1089452 RepID=X0A483_FUSOX|nr:hypothetical protein FOMG_15489 [Fusarium oxysporum f. sp. melonis 26406]
MSFEVNTPFYQLVWVPLLIIVRKGPSSLLHGVD